MDSLPYKKRLSHVLVSKFGIRYRKNLKHYQKTNENVYISDPRLWILILMSKIFPPNLKTAQLKQRDPITLVSRLPLYFIGTTIDVFTSYASL